MVHRQPRTTILSTTQLKSNFTTIQLKTNDI